MAFSFTAGTLSATPSHRLPAGLRRVTAEMPCLPPMARSAAMPRTVPT